MYWCRLCIFSRRCPYIVHHRETYVVDYREMYIAGTQHDVLRGSGALVSMLNPKPLQKEHLNPNSFTCTIVETP